MSGSFSPSLFTFSIHFFDLVEFDFSILSGTQVVMKYWNELSP